LFSRNSSGMTRRIYILDCAGASRDELRSRALAAGLRVMDVRLDEDHAEVDADGDGIPDWGCATVDVVEVSSLRGAGPRQEGARADGLREILGGT